MQIAAAPGLLPVFQRSRAGPAAGADRADRGPQLPAAVRRSDRAGAVAGGADRAGAASKRKAGSLIAGRVCWTRCGGLCCCGSLWAGAAPLARIIPACAACARCAACGLWPAAAPAGG